MRYNILVFIALCLLCNGCELSTSVDAFVEPMNSVRGYLSFQQNDRLFYEMSTRTVSSTEEALVWDSGFRGTDVDSADVTIVQGDRASTDMFRVILPEIWYHEINAIGQSFVISNDVVRDVRVGSDSMVLFDRGREKNWLYPLAYRAGTIGSISLIGVNIPVSHYGRSTSVDRYRLDLEAQQTVYVDIEPGATILRTVSITPVVNSSRYDARTCYYQRLTHVPTYVISVK
ncbi:MAG: hypothetical protein JSS89_06060 [Bacteroidetes bacterium]|nr:hypothetical protein [Bacteroidota bacterium]